MMFSYITVVEKQMIAQIYIIFTYKYNMKNNFVPLLILKCVFYIYIKGTFNSKTLDRFQIDHSDVLTNN